MTLHEIQVECYAGSQAEEKPRRVTIDGHAHIVARLLGESLEEMWTSRNQKRRFRILTSDALVLEVLRTSDGSWYLESQQPAENES